MLKSEIKTFDASKRKSFFEFVFQNIRELIVFRHALFNFVSTKLSSRYRRSAVGFLWSLLNPLFTMLIMSVVFSSLYNRSFSDFSQYLFSGLTAWGFITASLTAGPNTLISSETYLKKVYIPKLLFPLVTIGVELINFLFSLISLFVIVTIFGSKIGLSLLLLPLVLLVLSVFLFGLVMLTSITAVYFRDLPHILQIIIVGLFYCTPILYHESMLDTWIQSLIALNPFYHFIHLFHLIIYETTFPSWAEWQICIIIALISFGLGIFIFYKKENDVVYRL